MASVTTTTLDPVLKQIYTAKRVKFVGYKNNPLLALLPKDEDFGGRNKPFPIWYGGNQGASRTFATAQAAKTAGLYQAFLLTRKKDYALSSIETEAIQASATDEMAFLKASTAEIDNTLRTVARSLAISLYRNTGGARGQIATGGIASTVFTLANPRDIVNFEVGQTLVNSTTDGTSGSLGTGDTTITAVNRRAGTITVASATNFSALDYLFRKGDFGLSINGLASWVPATTPSAAENYLGVDRSTDTRLYGQYHDGSAQTIQEAIQDADMKVNVEGGSLSHMFMNPADVNRLRKSLGSQVVFDKVKSPDMAVVSFDTIALAGMSGNRIQIISDRNCPEHVCFGLTLEAWEWNSLGSAPKILETNGVKFQWDASADSIEIRTGYYGNLGCYAPSFNIQVLLSS